MEEPEIIVEKREELIASSTSNNSIQTLRTAHFLNPIHVSIEEPNPRNHSSLSFEPEKYPLNVNFSGWRYSTNKWKSWVHHMEGIYQSVWKRAGIYEAIKNSTCSIKRDDDLIIGLAEKWCSETNTFIFPWAEATSTLEDVMILGGYSVLGSPVFSCSLDSREVETIEKKLKEARTELGRRPSRKASQTGWMSMFMCSGSEIEHEAFISLWLQRFVFPDSEQILKARVFPVAIRLAKGEIVALAPAVLASIYRDLGLLKATILAASEFETSKDSEDVLAVTVWSPMHLVQIWAWERFPAFQPNPNFVKNDDSRSALWDMVKGKKVGNVRLALDSAAETFNWRPYATRLCSSNLLNFYNEKEEWQDLESNQELLPFALCLRVSELVGFGCIEQYLPHRVARQFGLDQDIPCDIARSNEIQEFAWLNYIRPFGHTKLYVPSKNSKPGVSIKYLEWWKPGEFGSCDMLKDAINSVVRKKRSSRKRSKWVSQAWIRKKGNNRTHVLPSPRNCHIGNIDDSYEDIKPRIGDVDFMCLASQTQNLDNAKVKIEPLTEMNSLEKPFEMTLQANTAIERTDSEAEIPACSTHHSKIVVKEESSANTFEMPLELEARIAELERAVAELKAKRFGSKFGRNCC